MRPKNLSKKSSQTLGAEYLTEQHCWRKGVLLPKNCVASSSSLLFTGPMPQQKWHRKISFETGSHSLLAISLRHQKSITPALPIFDRFTKDIGSLHKRESFSESVCKNQISLNSLEPTLEGRNDTGHVQDPQGSHGWPRQKGNPMDFFFLSPKANLNPICFYHVFVSVNFDLSFHCLQKIHH